MLIHEVTTAGAIPALEMKLRFAGQRQSLLAHNIANADTPDFRPKDVSVRGFQRVLGEAVDRRRAATGGERGSLEWKGSREVQPDRRGGLRLQPRTPSGNVLFHDRNNRDLERMMQALAENTGAYRVTADLLKSRYNIVQGAIRQSP